VNRFLPALPRSRFKRLVLGTALCQHAKLSTTLKSPEGLKDLECKRGQLSSQPLIPYVLPTNLVTTKEALESLKIKLPNGTIFNMSIVSRGNTEEYLAYIVAVLRFINQKGPDVQCRKLAKAVDKLAGTLKNLQKSSGPTGSRSKDKKEARKLELIQAKEMLQEAQKTHNEATAKTYKLVRNILSGDTQSQCDHICWEMHESDSWAGVNGEMTEGRHPRLWTALKLHKLIVFTADAAKRQQFYIKQAVLKPQWATVQQHILQMGVFYD
jgi:hypothetical protein